MIYTIFVVEECTRTKKDNYALPYIITDRTKYNVSALQPGEEMSVEYYSVGFKVVVKYTLSPESHDDLAFVSVVGKEFWLFNTFLLWGWVS